MLSKLTKTWWRPCTCQVPGGFWWAQLYFWMSLAILGVPKPVFGSQSGYLFGWSIGWSRQTDMFEWERDIWILSPWQHRLRSLLLLPEQSKQLIYFQIQLMQKSSKPKTLKLDSFKWKPYWAYKVSEIWASGIRMTPQQWSSGHASSFCHTHCFLGPLESLQWIWYPTQGHHECEVNPFPSYLKASCYTSRTCWGLPQRAALSDQGTPDLQRNHQDKCPAPQSFPAPLPSVSGPTS